MNPDQIIPRLDTMQAIALQARGDAQLAPIWAEKLRHTFTKVLEITYPDLAFAAGDVLPVDTSVSPAALEWEYFQLDTAGYADWIDDDGHVAPNQSMQMSRHTGRMAELGHAYDWTIFDLERAAMAGLPLTSKKAEVARRTHEALTNWVWACGDSAKQLPGLLTHLNVPVTMAPLNAGATSRLWANKTNDEIASDVELAIDTISTNTNEQRKGKTLYMSASMFRELRNRRLGAGDGFASLLGLLQDRYSGDASGQGKVEFKILAECSASQRINPKTGTDTSGIAGDILFVIGDGLSKDDACFIRARPFTQRAPENSGFKIMNYTHSKIGGCKIQEPLAFHRVDFGTT